MTEQEMHQGPGVYGGLETHRGVRHECPAPDCGPLIEQTEAVADQESAQLREAVERVRKVLDRSGGGDWTVGLADVRAALEGAEG